MPTPSAHRPGQDARGRPPLYITRKFPPSIGGMETLAATVWTALRTTDERSVLVAHGGSVALTPLWLPWGVARLLAHLLRRDVGAVLCGDVALYALIGPVLRACRVDHVVMAMGLDVTYDRALYRRIALPGLRRAPRVLAISRSTADAVRSAGVDPGRVVTLRLGLPDPGVTGAERAAARAGLRRDLGVAADAPVLTTVGRLVPRKGVAWFTAEVLPSLPPDVHYVVVGDGPDRAAVEAAAERSGVRGRVHLLGRVDAPARARAMRAPDVFVQPNGPVPGDMEGFGLVVLEAAMQGPLVVAAQLEGLADAVEDGVTGDLLPPRDAAAWIGALDRLLADPAGLAERAARACAACIERSSIEAMGAQIGAELHLGG